MVGCVADFQPQQTLTPSPPMLPGYLASLHTLTLDVVTLQWLARAVLCCTSVGLCKCVNERALLVCEWRGALLWVTREPTHQPYAFVAPFTLRLFLACFSPYPSNLFLSFLHFSLVSVSSFDMLLIVRRNTKQTKYTTHYDPILRSRHNVHTIRRRASHPLKCASFRWSFRTPCIP